LTKNLYVGNLSHTITDADLESVFDQYGRVRRAQVALDRHTGQSRGFAFVEMADGGDDAIAALNGADWGGRALKVSEAKS
jgi:RNA recognition motif-containing protein